MSIQSDLAKILSARYGKDVRQAIHDSIEEGYNIAVQAEGKATTAQNSAQASANASAQSSASALQSAQLAGQYKDEAFSGTPQGYDALVEKVNSIYRETASNYAIIGTAEGSALAHTIYGMSEQDGTPTPDTPVELQNAKADFKCVGKNLINPSLYIITSSVTGHGITITNNGDGTFTMNGTSDTDVGGDGWIALNLTVWGRNTVIDGVDTVRLVGTPSGLNENAKLQLADNNTSSTSWLNDTGNGININTLDGKITLYALRVEFKPSVTFDNVIFKPMLTLDLDATYDDYEQYQGTEVTTDLTLRAIEVTSSDDYNLERDGKYYVADTVDWSEDNGYVITRRIGIRNITMMRAIGSLPKYAIVASASFNCNEFILPDVDTTAPLLYCNRFKVVGWSSYLSNDETLSYNGTLNVLYLRNDSIESLDEWNTWIANNNVEVYGILKKSTTEAITSAQAQTLLSLKTYDEATSITAESDVEPIMDLEYSKDRNTALALTGHNVAHKNALKLAELNTALLEVMAEQEA